MLTTTTVAIIYIQFSTTGLIAHKVGKIFATYTHSLGGVTPNVIIIYCSYGLGESIGRGSQAQISAVATVFCLPPLLAITFPRARLNPYTHGGAAAILLVRAVPAVRLRQRRVSRRNFREISVCVRGREAFGLAPSLLFGTTWCDLCFDSRCGRKQ